MEVKTRSCYSASDLTPEYFKLLGQQLDKYEVSQEQSQEEVKGGRVWERTRRDTFIENWLKIRTKTQYHAALQLNRVQREYSRRCTNQNIVLKARQVGITSYIAARFFVQTIARHGTLSLQVTHDRQSAEDIFRIVRRFWDNLPDELREGFLRTSHCNVRQLIFPNLDSEYCLASAEENAGRGRTIQNLHCSEVSRWGRKGDEALASLRAAVVPGGEIVLESTPNGAGGLFYEEWQRANENGYQKHFFPWWFDDSYVLDPGPAFAPTEEERELMEREGLRAEQIAWRRRQRASLRGLAVQEFAEDPVSCFRASGECVFDLEAIEQALQGSSEPLQVRDNHRLMIWLPAQAGREYVIGVDPAGGGIEGDYCSAEVIDRESGIQCAELHGHYRPAELARKIVDLGIEYNTALLAVERNNHGGAVIAHLQMLEYPNLYRQGGEDGWLTTVATRPVMIEHLGVALMEDPRLFRSLTLLNECRTFVRSVDGNTGAAPGTHDDCVIAMAIAWRVRAIEAGRGIRFRRQ